MRRMAGREGSPTRLCDALRFVLTDALHCTAAQWGKTTLTVHQARGRVLVRRSPSALLDWLARTAAAGAMATPPPRCRCRPQQLLPRPLQRPAVPHPAFPAGGLTKASATGISMNWRRQSAATLFLPPRRMPMRLLPWRWRRPRLSRPQSLSNGSLHHNQIQYHRLVSWESNLPCQRCNNLKRPTWRPQRRLTRARQLRRHHPQPLPLRRVRLRKLGGPSVA